jgi:phosphohistidine phosphatase SixA
MQRRLIVLRHAKSSWKSGAQTDHERPLKGRGRRDAPRVGAHLAALGWVPQRVLSSDAQRTQETWARMADCFEPSPEVSFHRELYLAGPSEVDEALCGLPPEVTCALVLGHNHGWEDVVTWLSGESVGLTTCNAALLSAEGDDWMDALASAPRWTLHQVIRPKELPPQD